MKKFLTRKFCMLELIKKPVTTKRNLYVVNYEF